MEIRVLSIVAIMRAIVDRIGCKLNVFNEDGVYRRDRANTAKIATIVVG